jgi:hypothetical protein
MRLMTTLVLAAALGLSVVVPATAQTDARQRTLLVTALHEDGTPVDTLNVKDVIVREDGVAREVLKVSRSTAPVDLTLIVDNSFASTRAQQDLRLGVEKFLSTFADPHPITLMTVADRPTVQVDSTTSKAQLLRGVQRLFVQPGSGTYLVEGIIEASKAIQKRKPARSAILAITSFGIEFSDRGYQFALDELARSGASLHVIELQDTAQASQQNSSVRDRNVVIDQGTAQTGGMRELLLANISLTDALQEAGRVITTQYEVVYGRPDTLIPARKVEVESARPALKLRGNVLQANRASR